MRASLWRLHRALRIYNNAAGDIVIRQQKEDWEDGGDHIIVVPRMHAGRVIAAIHGASVDPSGEGDD